ncbi:MAG: aminotransferase class V-fold PLP-dependent enzyme [Longimicrobiales bacterium]|nr:aminotransferase class V-fold PLP-dependent enzyme [Longimicrobiales bacterium]
MSYQSGRHFLQLPGPTNTPERVLRAMSKPTIDHRGPEFEALTHRLLADLRWICGTTDDVFIYPASGSGAWEAAIVNTLSSGDTVVAFEQGFFAQSWAQVAVRFGLDVRLQSWDGRQGVTPDAVTKLLSDDGNQAIKAVMIVHNETSTGVTTNIKAIAAAMQASGHPALLFIDAVSSLAVTDLRHDEWGLDVTVSGSQKGLTLPPGLAVMAAGPRAIAAHESATIPRSYWDWDDQRAANAKGSFPYTPATNLLYGLEEAFAMLREEGMDNVFARHRRFGSAVRAAVATWGFDTVSTVASEASQAATAVIMPDGHDADALRALILERFDMSLGTGLGEWKGRVFRIGHLGDLNALALMGTLAGVEMGLGLAGIPHTAGGVAAAMAVLAEEAS